MSEEKDFHVWGNSISQEEILFPRSNDFLHSIKKFPFIRLVDTQKKNLEEALILDFIVELPQNPPVPIQRSERIALVIPPDENLPPLVLALRKDFPETLHQNITPRGMPKSLCLFDEPFSEINIRTTPIMYLQRIANWLCRAASEDLHLPDQPLEPLLLTPGRIIFDPRIFLGNIQDVSFFVRIITLDPLLLKTYRQEDILEIPSEKKEIPYILLPITVQPTETRMIEALPVNLEDLSLLLNKLQFNLTNYLQGLYNQLYRKKELPRYLEKELIFILKLPKIRKENSTYESIEYWAFIVHSTIEQLFIKLGFSDEFNGYLGVLLGKSEAKNVNTIPVTPLLPTYSLTRDFANKLSNIQEDPENIVVIGLGALGSQIVLDLSRQGFGKWYLVDFDVLLPHNLSKHGLSYIYEGQNKSKAMAYEINGLLNENEVAESYPYDILKLPKEDVKAKQLQEKIDNSDLILDFSTSKAVSSHLSSKNIKANKICCFINPTARYLALLSEGKSRKVFLDDLERQLFEKIIMNPDLSDFANGDITSTQYTGSCRDASVNIPQDTISLFAGIASKFIKDNHKNDEPNLIIWRLDYDNLEVKTFKYPVSMVNKYLINKWSIHITQNVITSLRKERLIYLPNETGGILLGNFDYQNKIIYVVSYLPSPSDSVEWPFSYIRGKDNLQEEVQKIKTLSGNELYYVGEWHSHPKGCSNDPSKDDLRALNYLNEEMEYEGYPGLMLIISDDYDPGILVGV